MLASNSCLNSLLASTTPARNAPRAGERPTNPIRAAIPIISINAVAVKISRRCDEAEVSDLLQQETDRLKALARAEVDDFWVTHYKVRENASFKDWGLLGVRIRDFKYGFGIEWYINSFHGQRDNRVVFSKGLRISKTKLRYSFLDCQGLAKEWELALAMEKEEFFSDIRRQVDKLNMLRRRLNAY